MCSTCCKEVRGWCKSFTVTEVLLTVLEAVLLIFFISFLIFLILHLIACTDSAPQLEIKTENTFSTIGPKKINSSKIVQHSEPAHKQTNLPPDIECTWTPSEKTSTVTQYFDYSRNQPNVTVIYDKLQDNLTTIKMWPVIGPQDMLMTPAQSNAEIADDEKPFIVALVKMLGPHNITFGCTLTIVSAFWTITAASCIESVKETDTLHMFYMVDNFGELVHSRTHVVMEMVVHPQYQSSNVTYDIVLLRSADNLVVYREKLLHLPTMIDYFVLAIGEKLSIIGFGKLRSNNRDPISSDVYEVAVHLLPLQQCKTKRLRLSSFMICAGVLSSRNTTCNYCAGTPLLLRGTVLIGIMTGNRHCNASCDLTLYVNIALVNDWMISVIGND